MTQPVSVNAVIYHPATEDDTLRRKVAKQINTQSTLESDNCLDQTYRIVRHFTIMVLTFQDTDDVE